MGPRPAGASVVKIATSSTRVTDCACRSDARLLMFFHKKGGDRGGGFIRGAPGYGTYQLRGAAHGTRQRPALRRLFTLMGLSGPRPGPTPVCGVRRSASGRARWRAAGSPVSLTPCLLMSIRIGPVGPSVPFRQVCTRGDPAGLGDRRRREARRVLLRKGRPRQPCVLLWLLLLTPKISM